LAAFFRCQCWFSAFVTYARKAIVIAPSLEDYENKVKSSPPSPSVTA
jgi:hypothetical protein